MFNILVPSAFEIKASSTILETCKLETVLTSQRVNKNYKVNQLKHTIAKFFSLVHVPPHVI
jgi:hypothetical protein